MSRRRIIGSRRAGLVVGLVLLAVGSLAFWRATDFPAAVLAVVWPIDLGTPPGHVADLVANWRLRAVQADRALCRRVLITPHVDVIELTDFGSADGCGWNNSVRLAGVGGIRLPVDKISCEMTAALALWLAHDVQPAAIALLGERVASVQHRGSYACRNIRGNPAHGHIRSEHARANAVDVASFTLASGRQVSVLKSWGRDDPESHFLAKIHSRACRYFRVAIGPAYNAAHRDHFHYDRGPYSACR